MSIGTHISSTQIQHSVSHQDSSGASQSFRTTQDVGWSEKSEQVLPPLVVTKVINLFVVGKYGDPLVQLVMLYTHMCIGYIRQRSEHAVYARSSKLIDCFLATKIFL